MIRYVAFLRSINVAGHNPVKMEDLRQYFEMTGIENIATYIQSGNVLFDTEETDEQKLTDKISKKLEKELGYKVTVIIRSLFDLRKVVKNMPYDTIKTEEKSKLYVTFLADVPAFDVRGSLGVYSNDAEYARVVNREVYIVSPNYGKTCFSNTFIEKKLGMPATTRNWATVNKILEL